MSDAAFLAAILLAAFLIYLAMNDRLKVYAGMMSSEFTLFNKTKADPACASVTTTAAAFDLVNRKLNRNTRADAIPPKMPFRIAIFRKVTTRAGVPYSTQLSGIHRAKVP